MKELIIYNFGEFESKDGDNFILGSFESFHLGHYQLLKQALANGGRVILVCFNAEKGMPKFNNSIFMDNYAKYEQLARLPIDMVVQLEFDKVSHLEGPEFLSALAQGKKVTFIGGEDFKFGSKGAWNLEYFQTDEYLANYKIQIVPLLNDSNVKISTSKLKESLEFGYIDLVNSLLAYDYAFSGIIMTNKITVNEKLAKIHPGLYASLFHIGEFVYYGILHINKNNERLIHLFDYEINDKFNNERVVTEVKKQVRIITSNFDDIINLNDIKIAKNYFK
ncbi:FAD synthase [Mycoplasma sp. 48589B]